MDEYEKQAADFLKNTNTTLTVEFDRHGKHFQDDKDTRDIYNITLERGSRKYSFKFGNSLHNSGEYIGHRIYCTNTMGKYMFTAAEAKKINPITKRELGIQKNPNFKQPTAYDVLACLTTYNPYDFENFCMDYGYDTDSRKAEGIYEAVKDEWQNVAMLWNDQEIEQLQEIQ